MNNKKTRMQLILIAFVYVLFIVLTKYIDFPRTEISYDTPNSVQTSSTQSGVDKVLKVSVSDGSVYGYKIILADTPALREKGLSGRTTLGTDEVMLFIFEKSARNYFWMKNMLFAIDIVWLDSDKQIIHIERSVKPESFPKSFGPDEDSKYVLEFREGVANSISMKVGDRVDF
ncbi:MAG: DUF192 domain-containing protein [Candidatus Pacebacteria bacterium]|nr:DUF192 domain-containing protein [Candidatus Paceibacterota bacterium]MBP9819054.1 DUF192 domain-containing protein [Candidatus Paceibacterota bacterium]